MAEDETLFNILKHLDNPKPKCIELVAKKHFKNDNTKFNSDALVAFIDVIKVFIGEAATRAAYEAKKDGSLDVFVTEEHLEKILPQLLLDF